MLRRLMLMFAAAFALAASAVQAGPFPADARPTLEPLYGVRTDAAGLTVRVQSSGCTHKESFDLRVKGPRRHPTVKVMRIHPDYCKAMFRIVEVNWSWRELGVRPGTDIRVANPRVVDPRIQR